MEATMARKKGAPESGETPKPRRTRDAVILIRSIPEWKHWVEELQAYERASSAGELIDRALVAYARMQGFHKPAPRR